MALSNRRIISKSLHSKSHGMEYSMDSLDELAIFVRIIEEGSLIRAARRLRRSPQAVTRALAALEDRIGQRLVHQTTRRLAATEAGFALFEKAPVLQNDYDEATLRTPEAPA